MKRYTADELAAILASHKAWLSVEPGGSRADLSGANLSGANLSRADLSGADLYGADLYGANLSRANLSRADLSGANLSGANLYGADLSGASLSRASLSGANLSGANLYGASLYGAVDWQTYTKSIVPAILAAGGKPLSEIVTEEHWACHSWDNCPMAAAFGVKDIAEVPDIHRTEAARFVELFDAKALPLDKVREWCGLSGAEGGKG